MRWSRISHSALLSALPLLSPAQAWCSGCGHPDELFPRATAGDGFLSIPVSRVPRSPDGLSRRAGAVDIDIVNEEFFYALNLTLGTPPQQITVLVDTGSAELWVNPDCSTADTSLQQSQCQSFGRYTPAQSTTPPVGPFGSETINYGDSDDETTQSTVNIVYYADTLRISSATVKNQTFGVATSSQGQGQSILGLAPDIKAGFTKDQPYSLVLNSLAEQGVIASRVFALDLRDQDSAGGALIFGGLDKAAFAGPLVKVPIAMGSDGGYRLTVNLTAVGMTNSQGQQKSYPLASADVNVMLDSGTTISRLHSALANPILADLGAIQDNEGYFLADCGLRNTTTTVDFGFGDALVRVSLADFILDITEGGYCYIGLLEAEDLQVLGDSVLRAGYFVFDWDNEQVGIAQAADCGGSDVVAVGSGTGAVPDVTGNCAVSDTTSFTAVASSTAPPASGYTTIFTVTSCAVFDTSCTTGVATTETLLPNPTALGTAASSTSKGGAASTAGIGAGAGFLVMTVITVMTTIL